MGVGAGVAASVALAKAALGDVEGAAVPEHAARISTRAPMRAGRRPNGAARAGVPTNRKPLASTRVERGASSVGRTGSAYLSLEGSSMHRVVGDRTHALIGAFTVAGLCRDLTGFATTRRWKWHGTTAAVAELQISLR